MINTKKSGNKTEMVPDQTDTKALSDKCGVNANGC